MPLEKAQWCDIFRMCTDKFGVSWMVNMSLASGEWISNGIKNYLPVQIKRLTIKLSNVQMIMNIIAYSTTMACAVLISVTANKQDKAYK